MFNCIFKFLKSKTKEPELSPDYYRIEALKRVDSNLKLETADLSGPSKFLKRLEELEKEEKVRLKEKLENFEEEKELERARLKERLENFEEEKVKEKEELKERLEKFEEKEV